MNTHIRNRILMLLCLLAPLLGSVGCKAGPAKNAGFVDGSLMKHDKLLPFQKSWIKPGWDRTKYTKVFIAPVNTSYLFKTSDWQKGERKDQFAKDVDTIGKYTENAMKKAFKEDPKHRMTLLESETKDPDALVVEMAIIEVVPSKVVLNALGYAPFFIGTGITLIRAAAKDVSTVAFEAKFRDAASGEPVALFADREAEQVAVVSVRGLTWYSHAQVIVSQWSGQFVQLMSQKPGEAIKDTDPFTLQPW